MDKREFELTRKFSLFGIVCAITSIVLWKLILPEINDEYLLASLIGMMTGLGIGCAFVILFTGVIPAFRMERKHKQWLKSFEGLKGLNKALNDYEEYSE